MLNRLPRFFRPQSAVDCESLGPVLSLYTDGMASPADVRRVEAHLKLCPECRLTLRWQQATHQAIAERPAALPADDLRARITRAIREADAAAAPQPNRAPVRRALFLRPALGYGFAIALFALMSGTAVWHVDHVAPVPVVVTPVSAPNRVAARPAAPRHLTTPKPQTVQLTPPAPAASPSSSSLVAEKPAAEHPARPAAPRVFIATPATVAERQSAQPMAGFRLKPEGSVAPVQHLSVARTAPNSDLVASKKPAHPLENLPVAPMPQNNVSPPQEIASLPHNPTIAPPAPVAVHVGTPTIAPDQVVVASLPTVNHTLQRIALKIDTDQTITAHAIALTKKNVETRFADDTSDNSGTIAITAGPVR